MNFRPMSGVIMRVLKPNYLRFNIEICQKLFLSEKKNQKIRDRFPVKLLFKLKIIKSKKISFNQKLLV